MINNLSLIISPSTLEKKMIDQTKITPLQYTTIFICFLMNMLDGMDVMVISYTAPSIAKEWAIEPSKLGLVFSAGLLGMAIGAMFLASKADIIGRRAMILLSASIMGVCVWSTVFAQSVETLLFIRFISGIGIGSMLASTATLASEYSPTKTKDFWVSFVMAGYPIGAVLSGIVAAKIIPLEGWRAMFQLAGIVTLFTLPIIYFFLAESLDFLLKSRPKNALNRANILLQKMQLPPLTELPFIESSIKKAAVAELFSENRKNNTFWLWLSIFMAFATLYFLTMWIPKLATNTGLSTELAIYAGTVFNLGAFFGIVSQGYLSAQFGLKRVICFFLITTALLMLVFGLFKGSVMVLILFGLIGFGIQGGFVGMYSVAAKLYPTQIRTTGVGWAVGLGRVGAVVGPIVGGLLIGMGLTMTTNFIIFAIPTIISGIAILFITFSDSK